MSYSILGWGRRRLLIAALAGLGFLGAGSSAGAVTFFEETWSGETAGDALDELTNWTLANGNAANGSIEDNDGDLELAFASPASNDTRTLRTNDTFSIAGHTAFKLSLSIHDLGTAAGPGGFFVLPDVTNGGNYRVEHDNGGQGNLSLRRGSASLTTSNRAGIRTALGDSTWNYGTESTWELQVDINEDSTDLTLRINGALILQYSDTDPARVTFDGPEFKQVQIRIYGWNRNDVAFDDIKLTSVPEPSTAGLLGLGVLALRRRRRTKVGL